jgi:hypothetical protein
MTSLQILLVQLGSNGDCLFVTAVAKQIKEDYPGCILTWLIGSKYASVLNNNPYVDEIFETPINSIEELGEMRNIIPQLITYLEQPFDKIFITDWTPETHHLWYGTTRTSLFRNYPHRIKNPEPQIFLTDEEKSNVKQFALNHGITKDGINILFESSPQSKQSDMSFERALRIANRMVTKCPYLKFIITSKEKFHSPPLIDGSVLSWRENAELTHYCKLLVGCSSGISWLNTSNAAAKIPTIQSINPNYFGSQLTASLKVDFQYFGLSTDKIIEMANPSDDALIACIDTAMHRNFAEAKKKYDYKKLMNFGGRRFMIDAIKNYKYTISNTKFVSSLILSTARHQLAKLIK